MLGRAGEAMKRRVRLFQVLEEAARWKRTALLSQCPVREMLAIVRRKLDADTAALVLIGARSCRLITSAAAGDTDERLDRSFRLIEGEMPAGQGAAVTVGDIRPIELEVATKLRARGLPSLLGVRLTARRTRGTLYIGLRDNRAFTGAELERLKLLSATLANHLDNVQPQAPPQSRVDVLAKELVAILLRDGDREPSLAVAATAAPRRRARCRRPRSRSGSRMR
jgi:hypothetical protein